jgi:hypothetical protein
MHSLMSETQAADDFLPDEELNRKEGPTPPESKKIKPQPVRRRRQRLTGRRAAPPLSKEGDFLPQIGRKGCGASDPKRGLPNDSDGEKLLPSPGRKMMSHVPWPEGERPRSQPEEGECHAPNRKWGIGAPPDRKEAGLSTACQAAGPRSCPEVEGRPCWPCSPRGSSPDLDRRGRAERRRFSTRPRTGRGRSAAWTPAPLLDI